MTLSWTKATGSTGSDAEFEEARRRRESITVKEFKYGLEVPRDTKRTKRTGIICGRN